LLAAYCKKYKKEDQRLMFNMMLLKDVSTRELGLKKLYRDINYDDVIAKLRGFSETHPTNKMNFLVELFVLLFEVVQQHHGQRQISLGAEETFPIYMHLLIKGQIPNLYSELCFMLHFKKQQEFPSDEDALQADYRLVQLECCVKQLMLKDFNTKDAEQVFMPKKTLRQNWISALIKYCDNKKLSERDTRWILELLLFILKRKFHMNEKQKKKFYSKFLASFVLENDFMNTINGINISDERYDNTNNNEEQEQEQEQNNNDNNENNINNNNNENDDKKVVEETDVDRGEREKILVFDDLLSNIGLTIRKCKSKEEEEKLRREEAKGDMLNFKLPKWSKAETPRDFTLESIFNRRSNQEKKPLKGGKEKEETSTDEDHDEDQLENNNNNNNNNNADASNKKIEKGKEKVEDDVEDDDDEENEIYHVNKDETICTVVVIFTRTHPFSVYSDLVCSMVSNDLVAIP